MRARVAQTRSAKVKRWSHAFAEASRNADPPRNLTESLLAGAKGGIPQPLGLKD
jgi:hypothetical protein